MRHTTDAGNQLISNDKDKFQHNIRETHRPLRQAVSFCSWHSGFVHFNPRLAPAPLSLPPSFMMSPTDVSDFPQYFRDY